MSGLALRLGAIDVGSHILVRSGLRWLRPDGHACHAGEAVAFCNIGVAGPGAPFAAESFDFQVTLAPRRAGRLRRAPEVARGGYLDRLAREQWRAETIWAYLEDVADGDATGDETTLTFHAGRRVTDIAEDHSGLLSGWHDRTRAWTGEIGGTTLLGIGTCEQDALLRGDDGAFAEMLAAAVGPVQIALCESEPLVPSAAVLAEQLARSPADIAAIRDDLARSFPGDGPAPTGRDWAFIGALLNGLERSPLTERYEQIGRSGLRTAGPADAVCLSLTTELPFTARHRRLGYALAIHSYRLAAIAPPVLRWLQRDFSFAIRPIDDIARDYAALAAGPRTLFVVNCLSTPRFESVQNYGLLDADTLQRLTGLRAKQLNLMLHDLERIAGIVVIDIDAIAADLGMLAHFPDDFHASGMLVGETRRELVHQLAAHGIAGFARGSADQELGRHRLPAAG